MNRTLPSTLLQRAGRWLVLLPLLSAAPALAQVDTYQFAASTTTYTPLPATATAVPAILADDAASGALPIGFSFVFDGTSYTSFRVSSNGFLSFNSAATSALGNNFSTGGTTERPLIAAYWDDMDGRDAAASAKYQLTGTGTTQVLTMEWLNWKHFGGTGPALSFQVKLYQTTNRVEVIYRQEANLLTNATASIGLAGVGTGSGSYLSVSDAVATPSTSSSTANDIIATTPPTGTVYAFTPAAPTACPTPRNLAATVTATGATLNWTTTGGGGTYTVVYGPTGFLPATGGTTVSGITGTTTTLTGLTPATGYQFYVTHNCGGANGNSPQAGPAGFTTNPVGPTNDDCATAATLTINPTCVTTTGTVAAASQSLPPSGTCGFATTAQDVWYRFVAGASSQSVAVTAAFSGVVELYSGTCPTPTSLTCATLTTGTTRTSLFGSLTAGQTYYLRVYASTTGLTGAAASFTICVATAPTAPVNDECAGAINIPIQYGTCVAQTIGTNVAATASAGAPTPGCANYMGGDIWFKVTVPASGTVTVQTDQASGSPVIDTGMSIYSGTCGNLTQLQCDDDSSPNGNFSLITLTGRTPGEVLYVRVWEYGNDNFGTIALCATSPSNCATPTALSAANITNTTADLSYVDGGAVPTGTFDIEYGLQGFSLGTGTSVTGIAGTMRQLTGLTPDTTYCFYVRKNCGAANGSSAYAGPVCFRTPLTVPTNDEPCGAVGLTLGGASVSGTNLGSTTSVQLGVIDNLPACSPSQAPKDVWYSFTATTNAVILNVTGTSIGMLRVFTSASCANGPFVPVGCQAAAGSAVGFSGPVTIPGLTVGQVYYIAASGYGSTDPNGGFTIQATATTVSATNAQAETEAFVVYPNPSNTGQLTLRLAAQAATGEATLLNALGQTVLTKTFAAGKAEQTLNTHGLATGVYTLQVRTGSQVLTRKVVLE